MKGLSCFFLKRKFTKKHSPKHYIKLDYANNHNTHENANDTDFKLSGVKAHQTRGVSASMALFDNAALDVILNAYLWKHRTQGYCPPM